MAGVPRSALGPFAGFFAFGALWGCWAAILPLVQESVGASKGALGLALLCVGLGTVPTMVAFAPLVDRRGPGVTPIALLALALAAVPPALADSVPALAATLLVWGAAAGAADVSLNAAAAEVEALTGVRVMQLAHALFSVGVLVGALAAGIARELGAGRTSILAGAAVVLTLSALANRDARKLDRGHVPGATRGFQLRRHVVVLGLVAFAAFLVEAGIESWSALFMERELDTGPLLGALGPASYALAMVAGRLSGHVLTGKVGDRRLLGGGALVSTLGLMLVAVATSPPLALLGFFLGGAGVSVAVPVAFSAAGRTVAVGERGSAVATVTTLGYLGLFAGPGLAGGVAETSGLRTVFVLLAAMCVGLAVVSRRVRLD